MYSALIRRHSMDLAFVVAFLVPLLVPTAVTSSPSPQAITVGAPAPDFTRQSSRGDVISLKDFQGKKAVVLYFYPKDETSVCTKEACAFRDSYQTFKDHDAEVIGVSADSAQSHQSFTRHHNLPFLLLSDQDGSLRKLYQVPSTLGLLPGRVTYLIDKKGIIRLIFNNMMNGEQHVSQALSILQSIQPEQ